MLNKQQTLATNYVTSISTKQLTSPHTLPSPTKSKNAKKDQCSIEDVESYKSITVGSDSDDNNEQKQIGQKSKPKLGQKQPQTEKNITQNSPQKLKKQETLHVSSLNNSKMVIGTDRIQSTEEAKKVEISNFMSPQNISKPEKPEQEETYSNVPQVLRKKLGKTMFIASKIGGDITQQNEQQSPLSIFSQSQQVIQSPQVSQVSKQQFSKTRQQSMFVQENTQPQRLKLRLSSYYHQPSLFGDKQDNNSIRSSQFIEGSGQERQFQSRQSIRAGTRTKSGIHRLSTIQDKLRNVNPNQMELQKKNTKLSFMNPSSIIEWIMATFSQNYILSDINKRIIDAKQQDYLDNQIIFWNLCILYSIIFATPLIINIQQLFDQSSNILNTSNVFIHILENKNNFKASAIFGFLLFIIFNILIAVYRYKSNYDQRVFNYRIGNIGEVFENIFAKYNWKIDNMKLFKFFLSQRYSQAQKALNKIDEQRTNILLKFEEKERCISKKQIRNIIIFLILIGALVSIILIDYLIYTQIPQDVIPFKGVVAVSKGFIIVSISDVISRLFKFFLKYINNKSENYTFGRSLSIMEPMVLYILTNISIFSYILMHTLVLSGSQQYTLIDISKDSDDYQCKYEQIGFQIGGLYLGSLVYGLLKTIFHFLFQKFVISYQAESMMKQQQQIILCCLSFLSFFTFFFASFLQIFMFYVEKFVLIRRMISTSESSKQNRYNFAVTQGINSLCVFIYFGIMLTLQSDIPDTFTSYPEKLCGPYGNSIGDFYYTYFNSNNVYQFILNIVTWMPILYILIILLFCFFIINKNNTSKWQEKIEAKQNELNTLKKNYQSQVSYLTRTLQCFEQDLIQYRNQGNPDDNNNKQNPSSIETIPLNEQKQSSNEIKQNDQTSIYNHLNGDKDSIISNSLQLTRKNTSNFSTSSPFQNGPRLRTDSQQQYSPQQSAIKNSHFSTFFKENPSPINTEPDQQDSKEIMKTNIGTTLTTKKTFFA